MGSTKRRSNSVCGSEFAISVKHSEEVPASVILRAGGSVGLLPVAKKSETRETAWGASHTSARQKLWEMTPAGMRSNSERRGLRGAGAPRLLRQPRLWGRRAPAAPKPPVEPAAVPQGRSADCGRASAAGRAAGAVGGRDHARGSAPRAQSSCKVVAKRGSWWRQLGPRRVRGAGLQIWLPAGPRARTAATPRIGSATRPTCAEPTPARAACGRARVPGCGLPHGGPDPQGGRRRFRASQPAACTAVGRVVQLAREVRPRRQAAKLISRRAQDAHGRDAPDRLSHSPYLR